MADHVLTGFLDRQLVEGMALAEASDLLTLVPVAGSPPERYLAHFGCRGLVRDDDGRIRVSEQFVVGIWFPAEFLREVDPFIVLTWLRPRRIWHPNISNRAPFICIGPIAPATGLVELLYRVFEVISWQRATLVETNALNGEACAWARANPDRWPVDRRPLKRRTTEVGVEPIEVRR